MVGCVIVYKGEIIGEGWHKKAGEPHAEVNAINTVANKSLLEASELYVNLEPCAHYGKTPPCADLIVKYKIPNVIIGAIDTHKIVGGKGVAHLKNNNCNVRVGVLKDDCLSLNKRFYTYHDKKRPYIILKWAASADGYIAPTFLEGQQRAPIFLTNVKSLQLVHQWRAQEQAILVGTETAVRDNPKLDVRHVEGRNPTRVVLDKTLRVPKNSNLLDKSNKTIVITNKNTKTPKDTKNLIFDKINFDKNLPQQICKVLYKHQIQSVIIEGGAKTLHGFVEDNLWDEARVFRSNNLLKTGVKAPYIYGTTTEILKILDNQLTIIKNDAR